MKPWQNGIIEVSESIKTSFKCQIRLAASVKQPREEQRKSTFLDFQVGIDFSIDNDKHIDRYISLWKGEVRTLHLTLDSKIWENI